MREPETSDPTSCDRQRCFVNMDPEGWAAGDRASLGVLPPIELPKSTFEDFDKQKLHTVGFERWPQWRDVD